MRDNSQAIAECSVHDEQNIKGFFGDYRFLSNYHQVPIIYNNNMYQSTEAAYQAAKCLKETDKAPFFVIGAGTARKRGSKEFMKLNKILMVPNWDEVKKQIMYDVNLIKYATNHDLGYKLLATGDKYLEETNYWGDIFWGVCDGIGDNELGKCLMKIREELKTVL